MSKRIHHLSPLALLALTACGGGGGGGSSSGSSSSGGSGSSGSSSYSILGKVIKGPLTNALVFLDYNDNGSFDAGETSYALLLMEATRLPVHKHQSLSLP